jgi:dTDP-4-amino-4,6-dideoxygalactose transaminase
MNSSPMIKLSQPVLAVEEMHAIQRVLEKKTIAMGEETHLFETELQAFIGNSRDIACVHTGTSALQLAIQACGIGHGDEVLVPSITYVASFQAISATGARPIACDINLTNGSIDAQDAESRVTSRTRAIMPVHYAGYWGQIDEVYALAAQHHLRVIEDAAHSFGGLRHGKRIGAEGDLICFSFDPIKNITSLDGGAVVSGDTELIHKLQDLRLLGVVGDTKKRYQGLRSWRFDVHEQGWRYHMNNVCAAVGRVQLAKVDTFFEKRKLIAATYAQALADIPILQKLDVFGDGVHNHIYPIFVESEYRDALQNFLLEHAIESGIQYFPNHLLSKYRGAALPNAECFHRSILVLPCHANLVDADLVRVIEVIRKFWRTAL